MAGLRHIAVIMDGNGRWARQRGLPRVAGHNKGVDAVRDLVSNCIKHKIQVLTLFAFSSENWSRPKLEVKLLMNLFLKLLKEEVSKLHDNGIRLKIIGGKEELEPKLQQLITNAEKLTENNSTLQLNLAINYGGRADIVNACKIIADRAQIGLVKPDKIDESLVASYLSLADVPEPDLLIRTSGEKRISNFLLWHLAYSEMYFTDVLWPDFDEVELVSAIDFFNSRERRFGRVANIDFNQVEENA